MMIGFNGLEAPTPFVRDLIRRGLGGVILFARNVEAPAQVARLTNALSGLAPAGPLLVAVDQEGGRVARLRRGFTALPPMRRLGETGDADLCERAGAICGRELRAVGFNYDFAPVLDVDTNPKNPVIGDRSFSRDPGEVARLGLAFARGLRASKVAACGKHFPGHGDTLADSHKTLPRLERDLDSLRQIELAPFREAVRAEIDSIMTAHVIYSALDPDLPATLSPKIMRRLLREELGYEGVVVSDDLEMAAIADRFDLGEAAKLALAAGIDLVLVCHREDRQEAVFKALAGCDRELLERAAARVDALARSLGAFAPVDPAEAERALARPEDAALLARLTAAPVGEDPTRG
jgi:beta-N-acetylhexosaminidase